MYTRHSLFSIWVCLFNVVLVGASCGIGQRSGNEVVANPSDGACGSIDIRNSVEGFQKLENCTVIEGKLHILLIDHAEQKDYEKFQFPLLREITGHLLLYRVYGLKTLRHIFPNLAVIRGQDLFYNYALVAYEMPDLEELGLVSLTTIMRGAVRLTKNTRLCYVDTIDWSRIAVGLKESDHHIQENKDETKCVNYCLEKCPTTVVDGKEAKRCWTANHCQKNLNCHCMSNSSACFDGGTKCCKGNCIGGCVEEMKDGRKTQKCIACRKVIYRNECLGRCPPTTYMFMQRRCLSAQQCLDLTRKTNSESGKWMLYDPKMPEHPPECVDECPTGYLPNSDQTRCVKCENECPKVCTPLLVDSIDSAQKLKGCNKIRGPLEIQIMGGSNIGIELEESLGEIREVTHYIKVVRSYALLSLHFFKSLRIIRGVSTDDVRPSTMSEQSRASLIVRDNSNLQELFTEEVTKNLKILKGNVNFHGNRKLCLNKIDNLVENLGLKDNVTQMDVSRTMNGDLMPCSVTKLNLSIHRILRNVVIVQWPKVKTSDERQTLAYVINYREVTSESVNIYQGRDACSDTIWKTIETGPEEIGDHITALIPNLKPWTKYAAYVQAVIMTTASNQAISDIKVFTTSPDYPTSPTDLKAVAMEPGELLVTWNPPKVPNGNVTHYYVYWQLQVLKTEPFDQRDYCKDPISSTKEQKTTKETESSKNTTQLGGNCCSCPKSKEELKEEERERQIEIEFENYLHDHVYCKRPDSLPDGIDEKYNLEMLTRLKRQIETRPPSPGRSSSHYSARANRRTTTAPPQGSAAQPNGSNQTQENTHLHMTVFDTKATLINLGHFQEYHIEVLACQDTDPKTGEKLCSNRAITVARTKRLEKADNINASTVEVRPIVNSTGDVMIKWDPPSQPNGLIIKYLIRYRLANQDDHQFLTVCVSPRKYREKGGHILSNIGAGNYTFNIAAVSLAGNGSYTPFMYFVIQPRAEREKPVNNTVIAVAIIVSAVVIILVIIVVWFIAKSRFTNQEMTVISPNPGYMPSDDLYISDEWEVPRDKIELLKELGQGSFGMVYEGKAIDLVDGYHEYKVAIKTVNDNAGFQERMNFLKEATTMKTFNCYHVVKLIGVVSKGQPALVIMELMANGDLKKYLRMHRPDEEETVGDPPSVREILQMAGEIADGMAYLSAKKFVHRDLAARNCMVSESKIVKIGDFGMTRDIYETDYYRKGNKGLLPVRWMAPESLKDGVFTTMSDVWSYGVVMWEMATLAAQPYQGLSNEEVVKFVTDRRIMEQPPNCPPKLWSIMQKCWQFRAKHRPTFMSVIEELVPDLDPDFQNVSYFFSEESHLDGEGEDARKSALTAHNAGLDDDDDDDMDDEEEEEEEEKFYDDMMDDIDDVAFAGLDSHEESRIPFMAAEDLSHHHHHSPTQGAPGMMVGGGMGPNSSSPTSAHHSPSHGNRGASSSSSSWSRAAGASRGPSGLVAGAGAGSGSGSPVECMMLEELPNGHRFSTCSSPTSATSATATSGDSKGSSKSSESYSHINGVANGHIYKPYSQRTKPC